MSKLACGCPGANVRTIERNHTDEITSTDNRTSDVLSTTYLTLRISLVA